MRLGHWRQAYRIHRQQVTAATLAMSSATARTPRRSPSNAYAPNSALEDSATCAEQVETYSSCTTAENPNMSCLHGQGRL